MITRAACTRLGFTLAFTIALGFALGLSTSSPRDEPASRAAPADAKEVIPVWWNRAELPEIQTVADCEGAWVTWRPNSEVPAHAHTVELTMPSGQLVEAKSCAEWRVLTDAGGYAYSTFNVSMGGNSPSAPRCTPRSLTSNQRGGAVSQESHGLLTREVFSRRTTRACEARA